MNSGVIQRIIASVKGRLPERQSILGVYAVIVFLVYSWTLLVSFYKIPSWISYLTIGQILAVYAYSFFVNFVESILVLTGVFILHFSLFIPFSHNKSEFLSRSVAAVVIMLLSVMIRLFLFQNYEDALVFVSGERVWWVVTILVALVFSIFSPKINWLRNALESFSERSTVFLYIYLPVSCIALAAVIIRNLS